MRETTVWTVEERVQYEGQWLRALAADEATAKKRAEKMQRAEDRAFRRRGQKRSWHPCSPERADGFVLGDSPSADGFIVRPFAVESPSLAPEARTPEET